MLASHASPLDVDVSALSQDSPAVSGRGKGAGGQAEEAKSLLGKGEKHQGSSSSGLAQRGAGLGDGRLATEAVQGMFPLAASSGGWGVPPPSVPALRWTGAVAGGGRSTDGSFGWGRGAKAPPTLAGLQVEYAHVHACVRVRMRVRARVHVRPPSPPFPAAATDQLLSHLASHARLAHPPTRTHHDPPAPTRPHNPQAPPSPSSLQWAAACPPACPPPQPPCRLAGGCCRRSRPSRRSTSWHTTLSSWH